MVLLILGKTNNHRSVRGKHIYPEQNKKIIIKYWPKTKYATELNPFVNASSEATAKEPVV